MSGYLHGGVLSYARAVANSSMGDTCAWLQWAQTRDADNQESVDSWTVAGVFPCGFQPVGTREAGTNEVTTQDRLRLPLSAAGNVSSRDRIRLTHRYGEVLGTPLDYVIEGDPLVGPTAVTVELTRVTT